MALPVFSAPYDAERWNDAPFFTDQGPEGGIVGIRGIVIVRPPAGSVGVPIPPVVVPPGATTDPTGPGDVAAGYRYLVTARWASSDYPTPVMPMCVYDYGGVAGDRPPNRARYRKRIWFGFMAYGWGVSNYTGTLGIHAGATKLATEAHAAASAATTLSVLGWGRGYADDRYLGNTAGTAVFEGLGHDRVMSVDSVGPLVKTSGPETTPGTVGAEWESSTYERRPGMIGFYVEVSAPSPNYLDGNANGQWVVAPLSRGPLRWTNNHVHVQGYSLRYRLNSGHPLLAGRISSSSTANGGYCCTVPRVWYADALAGAADAAIPRELHAGNWGAIPANLPNIARSVIRGFGSTNNFTYADLLPVFDLKLGAGPAARFLAAGELIRNPRAFPAPSVALREIEVADHETRRANIDFTTGIYADSRTNWLLAGQQGTPESSNSPPPGGFSGAQGDEPTVAAADIEYPVRARGLSNRWIGAAFGADGAAVWPPRHVVELEVHGVRHFSSVSRVGINGGTYYVEEARYLGRPGNWFIRCARAYPEPVAPSADA